MVDGINTYYRRRGHGNPVLWLHHSGGETQLQPWHDAISKNYDLILPDLPGFGKSEKGWVESIDDMAYFVLEFSKALGLKKPILLGSSMGGWIAAELAVLRPKFPGALILVSAAGLRVKGYIPPDYFLMFEPEKIGRVLFKDQTLAKRLMPDLHNSKDEVLEGFYKNFARSMELIWDPYLFNPKLERRLKYVRVPTLIVWGRNDSLISVDHAYLYQKAINGSTVHILDDCGHSVAAEKPEAFTGLVLEWMEKTKL